MDHPSCPPRPTGPLHPPVRQAKGFGSRGLYLSAKPWVSAVNIILKGPKTWKINHYEYPSQVLQSEKCMIMHICSDWNAGTLETFLEIRRPLLARGHQAARGIVSCTIYIYICMLHLHPLILYDNVSCCMLYSVCCIHQAVCSSVPWEPNFYHLLARVAGFWVSLMRPWNSLKFQTICNASQNHQNGSLRPPKDSKMVCKVVPETI